LFVELVIKAHRELLTPLVNSFLIEKESIDIGQIAKSHGS
jgi:hypothetical protein